jgi:hypothetical protein
MIFGGIRLARTARSPRTTVCHFDDFEALKATQLMFPFVQKGHIVTFVVLLFIGSPANEREGSDAKLYFDFSGRRIRTRLDGHRERAKPGARCFEHPSADSKRDANPEGRLLQMGPLSAGIALDLRPALGLQMCSLLTSAAI